MEQGDQHHSDKEGFPYKLLLYVSSCCSTHVVAEV